MSSKKYVCKLSRELQDRARVELNEDPDRREEDIETIREWMIKQPHINGRTDDSFILMFLRNCKFSLERTKEKIDNYYTLKTAIPEWFADRDPQRTDIQDLLKLGMIIPLGYDNEGRKIILGKMGGFDFDRYKVQDFMRLDMLIVDYIMTDEQTQICGMVMINDLAGMAAASMVHFTPTVMKKMLHCFQDCIPTRMKGFNYWNTSPFFDAMFALSKTFMKPKMLKRLHVHGCNLTSLHSQIPMECLPTEYGGTAGDLQYFIDKIAEDVMTMRDAVLEDETFFIDESSRPGKPKTQEDIFGIDGSFRKLNVD